MMEFGTVQTDQRPCTIKMEVVSSFGMVQSDQRSCTIKMEVVSSFGMVQLTSALVP